MACKIAPKPHPNNLIIKNVVCFVEMVLWGYSGTNHQMPDLTPRCELIAPLDNMLWNRKLITALFDFTYKWELYTPQEQRKYGYYVLPILYGDRFIGHIEAVCARTPKQLIIKDCWFEDGIIQTKKMLAKIEKCVLRFA